MSLLLFVVYSRGSVMRVLEARLAMLSLLYRFSRAVGGGERAVNRKVGVSEYGIRGGDRRNEEQMMFCREEN
jgi:hypothetical protein